MAVPLAAVVGQLAKNLVFDVLTEPEKGIKYVLYIIIGLCGMILLFALPIILLVSVPLLLLNNFGATSDPQLQKRQFAKLAIYENAPITINQRLLQWVNEKKAQFVYCDDILVNFNYNLSWQPILAIDAVRLNQDYTQTQENDVLILAEKFLIKEDYTEQYKVEEQYEETEHYLKEEIVKDAYGKVSIILAPATRTITKTKNVVKTRAIIYISTKTFDMVLNDMGFSLEDKKIAKNMYLTIGDIDLEGNLNIYDDIDLGALTEYPPGVANVPYFNQSDRRWGAEPYGKTGTIKSSGCGPTCLAMILASAGRSDITPKIIADWAVVNGYRAEGAGSYWSLLTSGANQLGLKVQEVSRKNPEAIVDALSKGYPIIASMGPGHFTNGGHFIVLRCLDGDGNVLVYDPVSINRSSVPWSLDVIMNESSTADGENGKPFWVYSQ